MTTPPKPDHEKRPFRFKLEGPFLRVSTMLLITPISPNFKGLKCSVFGRFRALQSRKIYVTTANYTTGNSRIKTVYEDEEKVASKLVKQITSKPFVWTQAELDKYNAGKTISWAVTFATLEFVSIEIGALLKGAETIGTALNIGWSFIGDGGVPSTESPTQYELDMVPRLGLKYQVSYIPTNSGISRKILVTLPDGRSSTYSLGTYPSGITIRIPT